MKTFCIIVGLAMVFMAIIAPFLFIWAWAYLEASLEEGWQTMWYARPLQLTKELSGAMGIFACLFGGCGGLFLVGFAMDTRGNR